MFNFFSETRELRFSHDICDEEKEFLKKRSEVLLKKFSKLDLGEKTPRNKNEVNKIYSTCCKLKYRPSGRNRTCAPAILVQRSNQLSQRPRKHFESGGALAIVYDQNQTILCRSRAERKFLKIWSLYNVGTSKDSN